MTHRPTAPIGVDDDVPRINPWPRRHRLALAAFCASIVLVAVSSFPLVHDRWQLSEMEWLAASCCAPVGEGADDCRVRLASLEDNATSLEERARVSLHNPIPRALVWLMGDDVDTMRREAGRRARQTASTCLVTRMRERGMSPDDRDALIAYVSAAVAAEADTRFHRDIAHALFRSHPDDPAVWPLARVAFGDEHDIGPLVEAAAANRLNPLSVAIGRRKEGGLSPVEAWQEFSDIMRGRLLDVVHYRYAGGERAVQNLTNVDPWSSGRDIAGRILLADLEEMEWLSHAHDWSQPAPENLDRRLAHFLTNIWGRYRAATEEAVRGMDERVWGRPILELAQALHLHDCEKVQSLARHFEYWPRTRPAIRLWCRG